MSIAELEFEELEQEAPVAQETLFAPEAPVVIERREPRVPLFGFEIDAIDMAGAIERIYGWIERGEMNCRFVVTPNVDHAVLFQDHAGLRDAYANASLVLADGAPVVAAARLLGRAVPARVAGSDLAPALFSATQSHHRPLRVYLLGAGPGVAARAAQNILARWPGVEVVGTDSPPLGFERNQTINDEVLERIAAAQPDVLIVGLGAPKQELWVNAHRERIHASVALCVGATIDFLAGEKRRAHNGCVAAGSNGCTACAASHAASRGAMLAARGFFRVSFGANGRPVPIARTAAFRSADSLAVNWNNASERLPVTIIRHHRFTDSFSKPLRRETAQRAHRAAKKFDLCCRQPPARRHGRRVRQ